MFRWVTISIALCAAFGCGSGTSPQFSADVPTDAPPTVSRVDPASANAGDTVTIFGFGFSIVPDNNIVSIGEAITAASGYRLLDSPTSSEIEAITITIPGGISPADHPVVVVVGENISNADITLTVVP